MATRQITCPTCSHAFAVAADARTAICPRCGKALPILSSGISLDFQMPIPKKKSEKKQAPPPPPPPPPAAAADAKLARISLRKASARPTRGFEDLSAVTRPASPAKGAVDLPPAPEATIPGDRGFHVEILPKAGGHRDRDAATGVDLPLRPPGAFIDPSQFTESGVGADEPTAVPHEGGELIQVESGEWPNQEPEQVIHDDTWSEGGPIDEVATAPEVPAPPLPPLPARGVPAAKARPPVPPARRPPPPQPPRPPPPPPPPVVLADDPKVTAMRLKAIDDEPALPDLGPPADLDQGPDLGGPPDLALGADLGVPDLGPPDLGADFGAPSDLDGPPPELGADLPTDLGGQPARGVPAAVPRTNTASFHRDLSPSQRVAALTDAIDDEVSREVALPPQPTGSVVYPPPQTPGTMTNLGLGPAADVADDGAPIVLPDTGIMVFVPDQPIEERAIGEEKPDPAAPRYKTGTTELSPVQLRRKPHAAGGHGVATRRGPSRELLASEKKSKLWLVLALGALVLVGVVVGLVLFLR
jgi:hypothetical protein